jgi:septum site-determining protein MinC
MTDRLRTGDSREQPTPPRPPVAIKGRADGLRVTVHGQTHGPVPAAAVEASLRQQLDQRGDAFFAGAAVTLELPPGPLDLALAARLGEILRAAGMRLAMVVAGDAAARPKPALAVERADAGMPADGTLVVHRTLRSGQRVAAAGTVVVLGDVNAGAEVLAGGSVIVWGRLRGIVEAGLDDAASGSHPAVVCALDLAPTQLRIGPAIARAPDDPGRMPVPEVARVQDGRIVVEVWR